MWTWDYSAFLSSGWRRAAIESAILALLAAGFVLATEPVVHEASETFATDAGGGTATKVETSGMALLAFALERAHAMPAPHSRLPLEFRVDVLRNGHLHLICRAHEADIAANVCRLIATAGLTQRFPELRRLDANTDPRVASHRWLRHAVAPASIVAVLWFLLRTSQVWLRRLRESRGSVGDSFRELQSWRAPQPQRPSAPPLSPSLPVGRVQRTAPGVKTLVGRPEQHEDPERESMVTPRSVPVPSSSHALAIGPRSAHDFEEPRAAPSATRVIYSVNQASRAGDPDILTEGPLAQLAELREQIARKRHSGCRVLRVAAATNSRYAKSQVAVRLAWLLAERGEMRVLLMESDPDAPALHNILRLGVPRGFGLSEQLQRMAGEGPPSPTTIVRLASSLNALVESAWGSRELLDSHYFSGVLAQQKTEHDVIILDGPVIDDWADAEMLQGATDGIVLVVASGTSLSDALSRAQSHFTHEEILSIVRTGEWQDQAISSRV